MFDAVVKAILDRDSQKEEERIKFLVQNYRERETFLLFPLAFVELLELGHMC